MDTYYRWMEVVTGPTLAGLSVISVPIGFSATGLPIGLQIIGSAQVDLAVLQLAHAYEDLARWVSRCPPVMFGAPEGIDQAVKQCCHIHRFFLYDLGLHPASS